MNTERELLDAGFTLTPQNAHTGLGDGKIYEKIDNGIRVYFVVNPDGLVAPFNPHLGVYEQPKVQDIEPPKEEIGEKSRRRKKSRNNTCRES